MNKNLFAFLFAAAIHSLFSVAALAENATADDVAQAYRELLGREATPDQITAYTSQNRTIASIRSEIQTSGEGVQYQFRKQKEAADALAEQERQEIAALKQQLRDAIQAREAAEAQAKLRTDALAAQQDYLINEYNAGLGAAPTSLPPLIPPQTQLPGYFGSPCKTQMNEAFLACGYDTACRLRAVGMYSGWCY
jgi:VIT1/CCC1 family predicted Fe2+/Mn2+ transporter